MVNGPVVDYDQPRMSQLGWTFAVDLGWLSGPGGPNRDVCPAASVLPFNAALPTITKRNGKQRLMQDTRLYIGWTYNIPTSVRKQSCALVSDPIHGARLYSIVPPQGFLHERVFESVEGNVSSDRILKK